MTERGDGNRGSGQVPTNKEAYEALSDFERVLEEALQDARTVDQQGEITLILLGVREEKKQLVAQHLKRNTEAFKALTVEFRAATKRLKKLEDEIKQIIEGAETASNVVGALAKVLDIAARVIL